MAEPDDTAPGGEKKGKGFKAFFSNKLGPLPMGAWLVIVGIGLGIAWYTANKKATQSQATYADATGGVPGVGNSAFGAYTQLTPVLPTTPAITNNDEWSKQALDYLIAYGFDPGFSDVALRHYLSGVVMTPTDKQIVNVALRRFGQPPSPVPETGQDINNPTVDNYFQQEGAGPAVWAALSDGTRRWVSPEEWQQLYETSNAPGGKRTPLLSTLGAANAFWSQPVIGINPAGLPAHANNNPITWDSSQVFPGTMPPVPPPLPSGGLNSPTATREYTIRPFDTLWGIANAAFAGQGYRYMEIFNANKDVLSDPNQLPSGLKIKIPN